MTDTAEVSVKVEGSSTLVSCQGASLCIEDLGDGRCIVGDFECSVPHALFTVVSEAVRIVESRGLEPMVSVHPKHPQIEGLRRLYFRLGLEQVYEVWGRPRKVAEV